MMDALFRRRYLGASGLWSPGYFVGVEPSPAPPVGHVTVRPRKKKGVRYRLRFDDEIYEFTSLKEANEFLAKAKRTLPEFAPAKAVEIASSGESLSDAKAADKASLAVVDAPDATRAQLEARIADMQASYGRMIERKLREIEEDDEEVMLLLRKSGISFSGASRCR